MIIFVRASKTWWRHQMETFSALLALCAGNSPSPVNSPHKGQWRGNLIFSLICAWINCWENNREAGDLRRRCAHYDVTVMGSYVNSERDHVRAQKRVLCEFSAFHMIVISLSSRRNGQHGRRHFLIHFCSFDFNLISYENFWMTMTSHWFR